MTEVGAVIDRDNQIIYWHLPPGRTVVSLPDSRDLWDVLWANRERLRGFVHVHPGADWPAPSFTDLTTFAAVETGLGQRLLWWITSANRTILLRWVGPHPLDYTTTRVADGSWCKELRRLAQEDGENSTTAP